MFGFLGSRRATATATVESGGDVATQRLEPAGVNLPEKRNYLAGDIRQGQLLRVIGAPASSGVAVNENSALGVSAVIACVRLLSDMVAKLPLELFQSTDNGPVEITDHSAIKLMGTMPSSFHTSYELRKQMMTGKGLGGNGYAKVTRDASYRPIRIDWIEPYRVDPQQVVSTSGERIAVYDIQGIEGTFTRADIIHIKGESNDGLIGISPVTMLRENIGTALSQTQAAGKMMRNGTSAPGFLKNEGAMLNPDQLNDARQDFDNNWAGMQNVGRVPILNGNFSFQQTNGMTMVDAQFIESRRFELQEIARHYGIPSFLIGDSTATSSWGTGIQEQTLGFLNFSLDPHLRSFEESLGHTLLTAAEIDAGYYFRFDRDELASVSRQDTAAYFNTMRNIGVYSVNDIREKLDEPMISEEEGGNDYQLPLNSSATKTEPAPEPAAAE